MKVVLFGATGMVGRGVLRECLLDPDVEAVLAVGRSTTGVQHPKLRELLRADMSDLSVWSSRPSSMPTSSTSPPTQGFGAELAGYDVCFFCLGVSSAGMSEKEYRRVTYELTLAVARTLLEHNPRMTFFYVSGTGTDSTERGRSMWARVKGRTENELLGLSFKAAYMFRPGFIIPMHGVKSRTRLYRIFYALLAPLLPLCRAVFPRYVTTTEQVGRAMLDVAKHGAPRRVLETPDINAAVQRQ
jgi:nucleoside-diphosphate-sugar epimerase